MSNPTELPDLDRLEALSDEDIEELAVDYYRAMTDSIDDVIGFGRAVERAVLARRAAPVSAPIVGDATLIHNDAPAVREFKEWLNERRMADVSLVFHEIVAKYRAALANQPAPAGMSTALAEVTEKLGRMSAENLSLGMENRQLREQLAAANQPAPTAAPEQVAPLTIPTQAMLNAARDWSVKKYGQGIGNDAAIGCWKAMLAAAPSPAKESK